MRYKLIFISNLSALRTPHEGLSMTLPILIDSTASHEMCVVLLVGRDPAQFCNRTRLLCTRLNNECPGIGFIVEQIPDNVDTLLCWNSEVRGVPHTVVGCCSGDGNGGPLTAGNPPRATHLCGWPPPNCQRAECGGVLQQCAGCRGRHNCWAWCVPVKLPTIPVGIRTGDVSECDIEPRAVAVSV